EFAREFAKVRLLRHSDGKNKGAGASRNLGIENAKFDYIAFLDADDFFLPGRFSAAKQLFETDPQIDGVYEAVGVHFENETAEQRWRAYHPVMMTTMTEKVPPDRLFESQAPLGGFGYCPTGGWVVKQSLFDKTGPVDENLRLHQDTAMFVKFAAVGRMVAGRLDEPVAMRRVHDHNRISAERPNVEVYRNLILMWTTLWMWSKIHLNEKHQRILLRRLLDYAAVPYSKTTSRLIKRFQSICQLTLLLLQYPELCLETFFWKKYIAKFYIHKFIYSIFLRKC
ncbi:MAG: glycosyltransferase, partial [Desulfatiglandales bacterium]